MTIKPTQQPASSLGIEAAYVADQERHGLCYFTWEDSKVIGAQCANCHTIIWSDAWGSHALIAKKPSNIPDSGQAYRAYHEMIIAQFLAEQPECPVCGCHHYDKFINNTSFPRFADGTTLDENAVGARLIKPLQEIHVWWIKM